MNKRAYYTDSYRCEFTAEIVEHTVDDDGRHQIVLDRTYFYPESGGQPADRGSLGRAAVVDVFMRAADGAVVHLVEADPQAEADTVTGRVDWARRFDHMQQHTGQHILSQAFIEQWGAATVGFHLSDTYATIDLDQSLTAVQIETAEARANQIVWDNRPIKVRFVSPESAADLPLRKRPTVDADQLRLVEIADFDLNACGGTHVAHTGEVGLIKVVKTETRNQNLRLTFLCGGRARDDYHAKTQILHELTAALTTGPEALPEAVQKMQAETKTAVKTADDLRRRLAVLDAERLLETAERVDGVRVVRHVFSADEASADIVRTVAGRLAERERVLALLALAGPQPLLVFHRSNDVAGHLGQTVRRVLADLGSTSGGGPPHFAQGGGFDASPERLAAALRQAQTALLGEA